MRSLSGSKIPNLLLERPLSLANERIVVPRYTTYNATYTSKCIHSRSKRFNTHWPFHQHTWETEYIGDTSPIVTLNTVLFHPEGKRTQGTTRYMTLLVRLCEAAQFLFVLEELSGPYHNRTPCTRIHTDACGLILISLHQIWLFKFFKHFKSFPSHVVSLCQGGQKCSITSRIRSLSFRGQWLVTLTCVGCTRDESLDELFGTLFRVFFHSWTLNTFLIFSNFIKTCLNWFTLT